MVISYIKIKLKYRNTKLNLNIYNAKYRVHSLILY
jgi:hypothetical protein